MTYHVVQHALHDNDGYHNVGELPIRTLYSALDMALSNLTRVKFCLLPLAVALSSLVETEIIACHTRIYNQIRACNTRRYDQIRACNTRRYNEIIACNTRRYNQIITCNKRR